VARKLFAPRERLVILGAGATVGEEFSPDVVQLCRPPLNADFFTQLQRITDKHTQVVKAVVKDVVELFGANFSLTLEDYFTQLEFLTYAAEYVTGKERVITVTELHAKRDRLMQALAAVLEMSTDYAIRHRSGAPHHDKLVEYLRPRDTVISFNYDCVIDDALRRIGGGRWSARYGYTFPKEFPPRSFEPWNANPAPTSPEETIYLLKLHGSLNWQVEADHVWIKQRLHRQYGIPRFTIVPPVWNKAMNETEEPVFRRLWQRAQRAIRSAESIAIIGFSFAPTDLHVEAAFRVALARSHLKTLVLANPSDYARRRTREVFSKALEKKAVVRQYDSFRDFIAAWPDCMNP
jgi:hypothetical protein